MRRWGMGCVLLAILWGGAASLSSRGDAASETSTAPSSAPSSAPSTQGGATTAPAAAPTVADVRALVTGAIAMKSDPKQAQAMMVRACELAAKLPPGSDVKALIVEFTPDRGELDHLMRPTATKVLEETKKLSAHVELCEKYLSSTYPFVGLADNGKGFIFPQPVTDKVLQEQALRRDGETIFSVVNDPRKETRWKEYSVSPDEAFVVLQDWLHAKPMEVLSVATGKRVSVQAPEIQGHYNVYPFQFVKWEGDSKSFTVEAGGTYVKGPGQFLAYRELWRVQADTGQARQIKRQEQPWSEKLKWEE